LLDFGRGQFIVAWWKKVVKNRKYWSILEGVGLNWKKIEFKGLAI
jgi:hypothetical protein